MLSAFLIFYSFEDSMKYLYYTYVFWINSILVCLKVLSFGLRTNINQKVFGNICVFNSSHDMYFIFYHSSIERVSYKVILMIH